MGKGGESSALLSKAINEPKVWMSSFDPLDKTVKLPSKGQVKNSIPKHCFEKSALKGMMYVFRDTLVGAACVYATTLLVTTECPPLLSTEFVYWFVVWNLYAFWMGTILTGHWVLAHECGHGAFSNSQTFNDIVGFCIHQCQLVPYFAWQYTHAKHHRRTNHITDGESHVPSTGIENGLGENGERLSFYAVLHESIGDEAFAVWQIWSHCVIGWPLYLLGLASTGRCGYDGEFLQDGEIMDHFRPSSKMFTEKVRGKILMSSIGVILMLALLFKLSLDHGFLTVFLWYTGPYLWTNFWLVLYTWLQHTDPSVPQYGPEEWTFVKGALTTIDRPYGIFDWFHHKIGSTHVAHHFFHEIPFYNGDEATVALKEFLGPLYNYDPTPWYMACWKIARTCHYIEGIDGVQYYKSMEDVPLTPNKKED